MFRSQKTHPDDDDDDEFSKLSRSSKLASIFNDDSPTKSPKDLKYVAPKQPVKVAVNAESQHTMHQNDSSKSEANSAILYAAAAELYSHKKGSPSSEGRVMCCIIRKSEDAHFVLLLYRTKKNVIAQARICAGFNMLVQKGNYVSFTDDVNTRWSLYVDGIKYQEFLTQIGICRSLSAFAGSSPPPRVTQPLSEGENSEALQRGDVPVVTFCSWQVQNYKRGKQIGELREGVEIRLDKTSWEAGLVNCRRGQDCLVFVPNVQVYETDKSSLIVYEVTIEALKKQEKPRPPEKAPQNGQKPSQSESEESTKAMLISRMARVGQPIVPLAASRRAPAHPVPPTDSESEEDHHHKRYHHGNARSSTSSSLEEINTTGNQQQQRKLSHTPGENDSSFEATHLAGVGPLGCPSYVPQGAGTVIAYHPFPFQQPQTNEASSKTSDPLLSLLFSETRSQNTDLRVALSQLTQKVDMVYAKVNAIETSGQQRMGSAGAASSGGALGLSASPQFSPHDFLAQISAMVDQIENYKRRLDESERKADELAKEYTQVLKKNQTLLEEKAELVALKGESGDSQKESKIHLQELLAVQERKIRLETELHSATIEIENLQNDLEQQRQKYSSLEASMRTQAASQAEQAQLESASRDQTVRQMNAQIIQLEGDLAEMRANEQRWREARKRKEEAIENMRSLLEEAQREAERQKRRATKAEEEKEQLEKKLAEEEEGRRMTKAHWEEELRSNEQKEALWTKTTEDEKALIEQLKATLAVSEKRLLQAEEENGRTIAALEEQLKNRDTYSWVSRPESAPSRAQTEAVVKQVMNATYRRVKAAFIDDEAYDKAAILQNILAAIRETTLLFLARRKEGEGEEGVSCPAPGGHASPAGKEEIVPSTAPSSPPRRTSASEPPVPRGTTSAGCDETGHAPSYSAAFVPTGQAACTDVGPPVTLPLASSTPPDSPVNDPSAQPPVVPTAPPNTPPPAQRTASPTDDCCETRPEKDGTEKPEEKSEDEEESWKPLPPPPPLFSDTDDDDDWLS